MEPATKEERPMSNTPHELHEEFPEHIDTLHRLKESDAILVGDEGEVVFFHSYFSSPDSSPLRFLSSLICSS